MYYVYEITLGDHYYVGCTNNLRRRKNQHNENARKRRSKLGRFLDDNGIVLNEYDLKVIWQNEDRPSALAMEKQTALEFEEHGNAMLNDNYTRNCSRKGKNLGHTAKEYYVVDFKNHTVRYANDLRQFCIKNGLDYKLVQRTTKGNRYCSSGHKAFFKEDWEHEENKEKYLSGEFLKEAAAEIANGVAERQAKTYEVAFPDGHTEIVRNLDRFAKDHNITSGTLHATLIFNNKTKGYQVLRRI